MDKLLVEAQCIANKWRFKRPGSDPLKAKDEKISTNRFNPKYTEELEEIVITLKSKIPKLKAL
jgi:hypothetical protein